MISFRLLTSLRSLFSSRRRNGILLVLLLAGTGFVAWSNWHVLNAGRDRLHTDLADVPARDVGVVFGTIPALANGNANLHFTGRIDAAVALYRAGKVRHLIVSGDNHTALYDEPTAMRDALIARGVPADAITRDYAGFRTLDTVVRAEAVFEAGPCVLITQRYHNTRALAIARARGVDAIGFCPPDLPRRYAIKTEIREVLARTLTVLDLHVWNRQPRFLGAAEPVRPQRQEG